MAIGFRDAIAKYGFPTASALYNTYDDACQARFVMSSPQSDEKSGRILRKAMVSVFPQLANARVGYCWGGLADMSMDRLVHAREHDGLFYSVGYSGHGVQMATYMGRQMAEYINGVEEANLWRDIPFKRIPGHFGPPWFLPFAGAYYKFQDLIKWAWACRLAATSSRGDADAHALDG